MVYFNNVGSGEQIIPDNKTIKNETTNTQKVKVVPVGETKEDKKSEDADKLPQGFCIEKTQDNTPAPEPATTSADDDDNTPNTQINTEKLELTESIAIANDQTKPVDDALNNAVRRGQNSIIKDNISKAENMIKDDPFKPIEQKFKKGFHASGLARFEYNNNEYYVPETSTKFNMADNTQRIDVIGTYENKSGNTKLYSYIKGAVTNRNLTIETKQSEIPTGEDNADTSVEMPMKDEFSAKNKEYCIYLGMKHKNITATAFHDKDEKMDSKTTAADAKYDLGIATVTGSAVIYNIGNAKSVKTNLSCKFNTFDNLAKEKENTPTEESALSENDNQKTENISNKDSKKWNKKRGFLIEFESENENEQGIGYYWDFNKNKPDAKTQINFFVKGSTTQREEEKNSYHFTTGANLKHRKIINQNTMLNAELDIKDKITAGGNDKGNILTAFGRTRISSPKWTGELEAKAIYTKDEKYNAAVLRGSYKANKKIELFGEASYTYENQHGSTLKNKTVQGGVKIAL